MKKKLPDTVIQKSINLESYGITGIAFTKDDILELLKNNDIGGFAVLGGDVLRLNSRENKYEYTYDNWFVSSRRVKESFEDFCERCVRESINYIEKYPMEDNVVFSPIITSEVTAGM